MGAVKLQDGGGKEPAKGVADLLRDVEACDALAEFYLGVPGGEVVDGTREEDGFCGAEDGAHDKELFVGSDGGRGGGDGAPDDDGYADVHSRPGYHGDQQVGRDLEGEVADEEDGDSGGELLRGHVEVFHDALQFCGGEVLAVDIIQNVQNADGGQDDKVDLAHDLAVEGFHFILAEGAKAVGHAVDDLAFCCGGFVCIFDGDLVGDLVHVGQYTIRSVVDCRVSN